nr:MAG TPA: hypothetical protein [Caudoviricetes sp.]
MVTKCTRVGSNPTLLVVVSDDGLLESKKFRITLIAVAAKLLLFVFRGGKL